MEDRKDQSPSWVGPFGWVAGCLGLLYFCFDIKSGGSLFGVIYAVAFGFLAWMLCKNGLILATVLFDKVYESQSSSSMKDKLGEILVKAAQKHTGAANGENPDMTGKSKEELEAELKRLQEIERQQQEQAA